MLREGKIILVVYVLITYPLQILSLVYEAVRAVFVCSVLIFLLSFGAWNLIDREKIQNIISRGAEIAGAFALGISSPDMRSRTLIVTQALNPNCKKFSLPNESNVYTNKQGKKFIQIWYKYDGKDYTHYLSYVPVKQRTHLIATYDDGREETIAVLQGAGEGLKPEVIDAVKLETRALAAKRRFA